MGGLRYVVATTKVPAVRDLPEFPQSLAKSLTASAKRGFSSDTSLPRRELVEHEREFHERRQADALAAIAAADDGDRRAAIMHHGTIVLSVADLLGDDNGVDLIEEAYEKSGGTEWDKHDRLIADMIEYVQENPWHLPPAPAQEVLPDGVREDQREDYAVVKDRKMLARIADREIRQEELEREAARLSLGRPTRLSDMLADPPTAPLWLVPDLLHAEKTRGLVIGEAKAGKSTFVHNLLGSLTSGSWFLDQYQVQREVRVAYVDLELGERLAYEWLEPIPGMKADNVEYYDRVGQGRKLDCRAEGLRRRWAQELADLGIDILIIDPISPVISALGLSEDSSEVRGLLDSFDELANLAGMSGVIVCHHAGHSNVERGRGSSAFNDWYTARMSILLQDGRVDLPRKFTVTGRGIAPVRGAELTKDLDGRLRLSFPSGTYASDPFVSHRDHELTLAEARQITGMSESSTRERLRQYGWSSGGSLGGRGKTAAWKYTLTPADSPF
ncbi:MAG: AAA family ATPase [Dehalococcoidia bacterium]